MLGHADLHHSFYDYEDQLCHISNNQFFLLDFSVWVSIFTGAIPTQLAADRREGKYYLLCFSFFGLSFLLILHCQTSGFKEKYLDSCLCHLNLYSIFACFRVKCSKCFPRSWLIWAKCNMYNTRWIICRFCPKPVCKRFLMNQSKWKQKLGSGKKLNHCPLYLESACLQLFPSICFESRDP